MQYSVSLVLLSITLWQVTAQVPTTPAPVPTTPAPVPTTPAPVPTQQPTSPVRICVGNGKRGETAACTAWAQRAATAGSTVTLECVHEDNNDLCLQRINNGQAELFRGGGNDIYSAGKYYSMQAYASESYDEAGGNAYYGVVVAKKSFCEARGNDVTMSDLKGLRVCTTGFRRTAGWTLPVGYLVSRAIMPIVSKESNVQDDAETFANFFSASCAPGTTNGSSTAVGPVNTGAREGATWGPLCTACGGQSCTSGSGYIGYDGAMRCMLSGAGDVVFNKHSAVLDYSIGGKTAQSWSVPQEDLRIICADNSGCRPVTEWATCSYARAPAHAFVGKPGSPAVEEATRLLAAASADPTWVAEGIRLGVLSTDAKLITARHPRGRPVTIPDLMGSDAYSSFQAIRDLQEPPQIKSSGGGNNGMSKGAVAGTVIGSILGTVLIAAVIGAVYVRKTKKDAYDQFLRDHELAKKAGAVV